MAAKGANVKCVEVGDRVGYAWMKASCRACKHCLKGDESICLKGYTGLITAGGAVRTPVWYTQAWRYAWDANACMELAARLHQPGRALPPYGGLYCTAAPARSC